LRLPVIKSIQADLQIHFWRKQKRVFADAGRRDGEGTIECARREPGERETGEEEEVTTARGGTVKFLHPMSRVSARRHASFSQGFRSIG